MKLLSRRLFTAAQIRTIEQVVITQYGIPGFTLMQRAARAVFEQAGAMLGPAGSVLVLCGPGNNGGDGYVAALLLKQAGYQVEVIGMADPDRLRGDALRACREWLDAGGEVQPFGAGLPSDCDLIIDAILGTGLQRPLRGEYLVAAQLINEHKAPVIAVDIPTGLSSETGNPLGSAVIATETVTFIGLKLGLFTGRAPDFCGTVVLEDLDCPEAAIVGIDPAVVRLLTEDLGNYLCPRSEVSHKGDFGHVLVLGGDQGMSGAARMAGEAALRCGAGLVSIGTHMDHAAVLNTGRPELMVRAIDRAATQRELMERATVLVVGPGLHESVWSHNCYLKAVEADEPLVLDAGAFTYLVAAPSRRENRILTPHPGEAARLLDIPVADVQADRLRAAKELRMQYGGVIVLKGAGTIIAGPGGFYLCDAGNPGMASGGMGDVLSGVIGGLLAQGFEAEMAACLGVVIHAAAGDRAAGKYPRGLLASDLMLPIRDLVNPS
ncbi:MAG TPA: NAD(P)H-hydrate dehydratase [Gammaproteobacteria bacterium]|nr:NAD(P)H-hydrate dehydratase [Gammaproteobacteria bacterium]